MIKINLALRKQAAALEAKKESGGGGTLSSFQQINVDSAKEFFKDPQVRKALLAVIVIGMGWYLLDGYKDDQIAKVDVAASEGDTRKIRK